MTEVEVKGEQYRISKLPALAQFHVARRLLPLVGNLAPALALVRDHDRTSPDAMLAILGPMADALSELSDEDGDYIIKTCLSACARKQGQSWAPVATKTGQMMFDDMDMPVMLQLTMKAIEENLGGFFTEPAR